MGEVGLAPFQLYSVLQGVHERLEEPAQEDVWQRPQGADGLFRRQSVGADSEQVLQRHGGSGRAPATSNFGRAADFLGHVRDFGHGKYLVQW